MTEGSKPSQLVSDLLEQWDADISREGHDPLPFLTNLTEIVEQEAINYWKYNPDPFDDRHPIKIKPDCQYGPILKKIFKTEDFIHRMVDSYCSARGEPGPVQTMAVRLLLSLLPGVESSAFFRDNEEIVERLYDWADKLPRDSDIRVYCIGLLGSAMQAELSTNFKETNQRVAGAVLEELWHIVNEKKENYIPPIGMKRPASSAVDEPTVKSRRMENGVFRALSPPQNPTDEVSSMLSDINLIIGDNSLFPITLNVKQRLYLQFLSPVAQYQDLLPVMQRHSVLALVDAYLDMRVVGDARLTFEALCLLASLLCHRKLASEFIQRPNSVLRLLTCVPRATLPAAGVSLCLYYLSYFEHAANRLCTSLARHVLVQLVEYALGLVQSGYLSSRNHAALFLAAMLPYNQILEIFDSLNGISYLYNSLSTLAIFHINPDEVMNENGTGDIIFGNGTIELSLEDILAEAGHRQLNRANQGVQAGNARPDNEASRNDDDAIVMNMNEEDGGDDTLSDSDMTGSDDDDGDDDEKESDEVVAAAQAARYPALAVKAYFDTHLHIKATSIAAKPNVNGILASQVAPTTPSASQAPPIGTLSPAASSMGPQTLPAPSVHSAVAVVQASPEQRHADLDLCLEALSNQKHGSKSHLKHKIHWLPVQQFVALNGPELLVRLAHMLIGQESYTGRTETIVAIFDSLAICSLERVISASMCTSLECPRCPDKTSGVIVALEATHTERAGDASVVKSSLSFLTVLCLAGNPLTSKSSPIHMKPPPVILTTPSTNMVFSQPKSQPNTPLNAKRLSEPPSPALPSGGGGGEIGSEVISEEKTEKPSSVFECIQMNDGIMRLRELLFKKTPVTEADAIRMHACRVLLGLAQSDTIRQILSRLSLFDHGQLQALVKEPVLQDKLADHQKFCRYASELAERVSGMRLPTEEEMREQFRKSNIVAKTSYRYDKRELVLLMYSFLRVNGLDDMMAQMLRNDGDIQNLPSGNSICPSLPQMIESLPLRRSKLASRIPRLFRSGSILVRQSLPGTPSGSKKTKPPPPGVPLPLNVRHSSLTKPKFLKKTDYLTSQADGILGASRNSHEDAVAMANTVDGIVAAYLKQQHAECPVPMSICPKFSLLTPHRCPVPLASGNCAPQSLPRRAGMCHVYPRWGGPHGRRLDRQFVFSRFQPIRTIRHTENLQFTCCSFLPPVWNGLAVGTDTGDVLMFDSDSGTEVSVFTCHPSPLTHIQFAPWNNGREQLFVTSSTWGSPLSAVWSMKLPESGGVAERDIQPDRKASLSEDNYAEFGHSCSFSAPLIVGTQENLAHLYDVSTGNLLMTLYDQERSSGYSCNRAHLDPADKMVLSDGLLWDIKSKKAIHKFDKLNADISGTFHPSGLEVIINCEVWDLRTYRLLRTVPDLNQCSIVFSGTGEVLYGAVLRSDPDFFASNNLANSPSKSPFGTMFRTFHADDYSPIASVDVRRNLFDLAVHPDDHTVALVDNDLNANNNDGNGESSVRVYAVGLAHPPENADALDDEQEEGGGGGDDDDDDDEEEDEEDEDSSLLGSESSYSAEDDDSSDDEEPPRRRRRAARNQPRADSENSPPAVLGVSAVEGLSSPMPFESSHGISNEDPSSSMNRADEVSVSEEEEDDDEDDEDEEDMESEVITLSSDDSSDGSSPRYQLSDRSRSAIE